MLWKRDKFPALRDLGKQILNQELQKTMSKVFKHTDAIIRSRTGEWSYNLFSSNSDVYNKETKSSKEKNNII